MRIQTCQPDQESAVVALWHECGLTRPWNDPHKDFQRKLAFQGELFLVGLEDDGRLVATIMAGYDGHRGHVNYLAISPDCRRRGLGKQMMQEVQRRLLALGCPKINLNVRHENTQVMAFYESLGYTVDHCACLGKRLISDEGAAS